MRYTSKDLGKAESIEGCRARNPMDDPRFSHQQKGKVEDPRKWEFQPVHQDALSFHGERQDPLNATNFSLSQSKRHNKFLEVRGPREIYCATIQYCSKSSFVNLERYKKHQSRNILNL